MPPKKTKPGAADKGKPARPRVVLVRHGKAQRNADSGRDEDRRLKPRGERQAKWLGKTLRERGWPLLALLHSPVHRAVQTANRLGEHAGCKPAEAEALALGAPPTGVVALIQARLKGKPGTLILVGHNPQLEEVACIMVPELRRKGVEISTGEALVIDLPADNSPTGGVLVERLRLDDDED
ncbi:MAG: histidine phosphatase family protein [Phycisphaerae bacterium]|nr:histidine phosphatase family protein [Phycisphaerae bacterium]